MSWRSGFLGKHLLLPLMASVLSACASFQSSETTDSARPKSFKQQYPQPVSPAESSFSPRQRILILPFMDAQNKRPEELRRAARDQFMKELIKTQRLVVIDSDELKTDLSAFSKSTEYEMNKLAPKVQALGIPVFLEGQIQDLRVKRASDEVGVFRQVKSRFEAQVRVRVMSSRSGKELFNTTKTVTLEDTGVRVAENASADQLLQSDPALLEKLLSDAFVDFIPSVISTCEKLSWEGRVAAIQGEKIYLNVGKLSGLKPGDILKVSGEGEDIFDPQTGQHIGKTSGAIRGTIEVVAYFGQDGAEAIIHSGAGFKENDRVELY